MSVKKDPSGRRSIQVEVEVPGTPEQVWQAIATGPGITSWFVPTEFEERDGRPVNVTSHFGPGMDSVAKVTAWEPPHRFAAESGGMGPDAPPMATEWIVEARGGGTCLVRVVHSLFASTDDWDNQLESVESGWPGFFRILLLYLKHFAGQRCSVIQVMAGAPGSESAAWDVVSKSLGLTGATVGQRVSAPAEGPPLKGVIERFGEGQHKHTVLLRLDEPAPGIASLGAMTCGAVLVHFSFYLYGDRGVTAAARDEPLWQAWMNERFPASNSGS